MNATNDQINFNFSRKLDIQKNLSLEKADNLYEKIFNHNYKNIFLEKHLKLLILNYFIVGMNLRINFNSYQCLKEGIILNRDIILIKFHHIQLKQ